MKTKPVEQLFHISAILNKLQSPVEVGISTLFQEKLQEENSVSTT